MLRTVIGKFFEIVKLNQPMKIEFDLLYLNPNLNKHKHIYLGINILYNSHKSKIQNKIKNTK